MSASLIILYVAFDMCYRGTLEVWQDVNVYWPRTSNV